MKGQTVPGWRKLRNSGAILPMTNWQQFESETTVDLGAGDICTPGGRRYWSDNYYPWQAQWLFYKPTALTTFMDSYIDTDLLQYLVQQSAANIINGGWDALTFFAELNQLQAMFKGVLSKLGSLIENNKRGLDPENLWLEGRYGWRTLTYDIRDLNQVVRSFNEKRLRHKQSNGELVTHTYENVFNSYTTAGHVMMTHHEEITLTINYRSTVVADINVPRLQINPITTAWEVTRLSFVVDWLFNIGQALSAASFLLKVKDYKACTGYRLEWDVQSYTDEIVADPGYVINHIYQGYTGTGYHERRFPYYVSSLPRLKLRWDGAKLIDSIALIVQRLNLK
jgi:hypothetical protein